jgi:hypothetical protein
MGRSKVGSVGFWRSLVAVREIFGKKKPALGAG